MKEIDFAYLTKEYLASCQRNWAFQKVGEIEIPLGDVYRRLQALPTPLPAKNESRSELAHSLGRLKHAGVSGAGPLQEPNPVDINRVITESRHIVLLGEPGSGKSTTLQYIALSLANGLYKQINLPEANIPILLSFKFYESMLSRPEITFDHVMETEISRILQINIDLARQLFEYWKNSKSIFLLADGFDETQDDSRQIIRNQLTHFANAPIGQNCHIVVTSRIAGYTAISRGFKDFTIKPFDSTKEVIPYLHGWFMVLHQGWTTDEIEQNTLRLLEQIKQQPGLSRILDNPLLLRLSAESFNTKEVFAPNRSELYDLWLDTIWVRAVQRGVPDTEKSKVFQQLELIAWALINNAQLPENVELQILREKMGILALIQDQLAFSHVIIREFFVSKYLLRCWTRDKKRVWKFLKPRLHLPTWKEPLLLLAGGLENSTELVEKLWLKRSKHEELLKRDLRLSLEMLGESKEIDYQLSRRVVKQAVTTYILQFLTFHNDSTDWSRLILHLGDRAIGPLLEKANDLLEGLAATRIIGKIKTDKSQSALEHIIQSRTVSNYSKRIAVQEIGKFQNQRAKEILYKLLQSDEFHVDAMIGLASMVDPVDLEELVKILDGSAEQHEVVSALSRTLAEIGGEKSEILLAQLLERFIPDKFAPYPYDYVIDALSKLGSRSSAQLLIGEIHKYQGTSQYLRTRKVAQALGQVTRKEVADSLWRFVLIYPSCRVEAAQSLKSIGEPRAIDKLLQAYTNYHDLPEAAELEEFIIASKDFRDISEMYQANLSDKEKAFYAIKKRSLEALGEVGDTRVVQLILNDFPEFLEYQAIIALGKIGDPRSLDRVLDSLNSKNYALRRESAIALGRMKDSRAVKRLAKALQENQSQPDIKAFPSLSLTSLSRKKKSIDYFQTVEHQESRIREEVVKSMGLIGDVVAIEPLISRFLHDPKIEVRVEAAEALGKISHPRSHSVLITMLTHLNTKSFSREQELEVDNLREKTIISIGNLAGYIKDIKRAEHITKLLLHNEKHSSTANIQNAVCEALSRVIIREEELRLASQPPVDLMASINGSFSRRNERKKLLIWGLLSVVGGMLALFVAISQEVVGDLLIRSRLESLDSAILFVIVILLIIIAALIGLATDWYKPHKN